MSSVVVLWSNALLSAFTLGTFPVRPLLFIILISLFFILYFAHHSRLHAFLEPFRKYIFRVTILAIIGSFVVPFLLQVTVFQEYGIPERDLAIFFSGNEITNSRIAHNHFGKIIIGAIFNSTEYESVADTGSALLPYVPMWVLVVDYLLVVIAFLGTILSGYSILGSQRLPLRRQRYAFLFLYSVSAFFVQEKMIDGGIASDGAGVALLAIVLLLTTSAKRFPKFFLPGSLLYGIGLLLLSAFGIYWSYDYLLLNLMHAATLTLLIATLAAMAWRGNRKIVGTLSLSICVVVLFQAVPTIQRTDTYMQAPLASDKSLLAVYKEEITMSDVRTVGTIGSLQIYDPTEAGFTTVGEVLNRYNLQYWYRPVTPGDSECASATNTYQRVERFSVLSPTVLTNSVTEPLFTILLTEVDVERAPLGWHRYSAVLRYSECIPRSLDVLKEALKKAGAPRAIVYELSSYRATSSVAGDSKEGRVDSSSIE